MQLISVTLHRMDRRFPCKLLAALFLFFSSCPNDVRGERVLGMANHYYSHQHILRKLGKELASRGYVYTQLIPHFLAEKFEDVELKVINTSLTSEQVEDVMIETTKAGDMSSVEGLLRIAQVVDEGKRQAAQFCADVFSNESLITELRENTDLIVCDTSSTCCFILADALNLTKVDVITLGFANGALASYLGFPQTPVYLTQDSITDPTDPAKFSFKRRVAGFIYYCIVRNLFVGMLPNELWVKHAKPTSKYTSMLDAWKPHNLVLIAHDFALEYPRPMGPHVKVIGAVSPELPKALPEDLVDFMSKNEKVVLVSFGSALSDYNFELVQVIAEGLGKVPATVLWKLKGSKSLNISQNIKTLSWIPQNDLLGHPSTKVFVTHGGLNGVLESAYHGVPMIAIPLAGDQHRHAAVVQVKRLGLTLDKNTMKAEDLARAIEEVLTNTLYQDNAKGISTLMRDRKRTPTEEGADWIEYALRHDGAKHLVSEALDLPEYQLYSLDVIVFLLVVLAVIIFMLVKLCTCVCRRKTAEKIKQN